MKMLIASVDGDWVLRHRGDPVLPIPYIEDKLRKTYGDKILILGTSFVDIRVAINDSTLSFEDLQTYIEDIFSDRYLFDPDDGEIKCAVVEENVDEDEETEDAYTAPDKPGDGTHADFDLEAFPHIKRFFEDSKKRRQEAAGDGQKTEEAPQPEPSPLEKCLAEAERLVGAENFKELVREIATVAPRISENRTYDSFTHRAYLFSVNDGNGLTTYLDILARTIGAAGIKKINRIHPVIEEKLSPKPQDPADTLEPISRILRGGKNGYLTILSIDISDWMNRLTDRAFRELLRMAEENMDNFIVVFRVPYVDKDVLERVYSAISDVMFLRTVSFPPFTNEEIKECARRLMAEHDFRMADSAWGIFLERMTDERSDGSYYGLNTVQKVVRELLYKKQLSDARRGKNDKLITKRDAMQIATAHDTGEDGYSMLSRLVGAEGIKQRVDEIISQIELSRRDPGLGSPSIHMRFVGSPGTGKTTVARIVGKILKERGVLRIGNFYEYSGRDFCGRYIGETAPKTASMCRDAYGSVLFIDEAYSLYRGDDNARDYGREALDTLIAEMENHRGDMVVIMSGYTDEMETLMKGNPGLAGRMPYVIEFPNFTREELYKIYVSMLGRKFEYSDDLLPAVRDYFDNLPDEVIGAKEFSNARFVRNLFERTWAKAALRCQLEKQKRVILLGDDFVRATKDSEFSLTARKKQNRIGFVN